MLFLSAIIFYYLSIIIMIFSPYISLYLQYIDIYIRQRYYLSRYFATKSMSIDLERFDNPVS